MTATPLSATADADLSHLAEWIGNTEVRRDTVHPGPVQALDATLDYPPRDVDRGTPLPPLWHWLNFLPLTRASEIDADGHTRRGAFLPPVPLPRRMWAGSRFAFHQPLQVGDALERRSTIENIQVKGGRSGRLVFVTVRHELHANARPQPALIEHHDIVYREARRADDPEPTPQPAPPDAAWRRAWRPDEVMLFRYSALTFNGHRIHYDRPYTMGVEGYPGLVVHGPLIATLLLDLVRRQAPQAELATFRFRAQRPTFDGRTMHVNGQPQADGKTIRLWAEDHEGWLTMDAEATLR